MIPRAVEQVFRVTEFMKTKGWQYKMEGQFLEIVRTHFETYMTSLDTVKYSITKPYTTF